MNPGGIPHRGLYSIGQAGFSGLSLKAES